MSIEIKININKDIYYSMLRYTHLYHYMHYLVDEDINVVVEGADSFVIINIKETTSPSIVSEIYAIVEKHRSFGGYFNVSDLEKASRHYGLKLSRRFNSENITMMFSGVLVGNDIDIIMETLKDIDLIDLMHIGSLSKVKEKLINWDILKPLYSNAVWMSPTRRTTYIEDIDLFNSTLMKYT